MTNTDTHEGLTIIRIFDVPVAKVWDMWTKPELVKKWWGPENFYSPGMKIDFRVGGRYIFGMHGPKGSEWDKDMWSAGEYKEIIPYKKIVATDYFSDKDGNMIDPSGAGQDSGFPKVLTVTVLFEEVKPGKTKLTVIYPHPATEEEHEAMLKSGMKEGWESSLEKMQKALVE